MADKHPHFIDKATAHAHGQFAAKARAAGMSTEAFARAHEHSPDKKLAAEARLALELIHFAHHGEARPPTPPLHDRVFPNHQ